jgi:hypothetical protein
MGYLNSILVLVGHNRKANHIGVDAQYVLLDALKVKGVAHLFIDVEQMGFDPLLLEERRHVGYAVVEPDLGIEIGIYKQYTQWLHQGPGSGVRGPGNLPLFDIKDHHSLSIHRSTVFLVSLV